MRVSSAANGQGRHHSVLDAGRAPTARQAQARPSIPHWRTSTRRAHSSSRSHQSAIRRPSLPAASKVVCLSFRGRLRKYVRVCVYRPPQAPARRLKVVVFPGFFIPASPSAFAATLGDDLAALLVQDELPPFLAILPPLLFAFAQFKFKFALACFVIGL